MIEDCVYLATLVSTVKQPYRNTATPKAEAGISSCVYTPNQAKYRPIFSPKYFLLNTGKRVTKLSQIWQGKQPPFKKRLHEMWTCRNPMPFTKFYTSHIKTFGLFWLCFQQPIKSSASFCHIQIHSGVSPPYSAQTMSNSM